MSSLNKLKTFGNSLFLFIVIVNFVIWPITLFNMYALSSAIAVTGLVVLAVNALMDRHLDTLNGYFEQLYTERWDQHLKGLNEPALEVLDEDGNSGDGLGADEEIDVEDESIDRRRLAQEEEARLREAYDEENLKQLRYGGFDKQADELEQLEEERRDVEELFEGEEVEELFLDDDKEEEEDPDADLAEIDLSKSEKEAEEEEIPVPKFTPGAKVAKWTLKRSYPKLEYKYRERTCKIETQTIQEKKGVHFMALLATKISVSLPEQKKSFKLSVVGDDKAWRKPWWKRWFRYIWMIILNKMKEWVGEKKSKWNKTIDKFEGIHTYGFPRIAKSWDKGILIVRRKKVDMVFKVEAVKDGDEAWLSQLFESPMVMEVFAEKLSAYDASIELGADSISYAAEFEIGSEKALDDAQSIITGLYMILEKMDFDAQRAKEAKEAAAATGPKKSLAGSLMEKFQNWSRVYNEKYKKNRNVDPDGRRLKGQ